MLSNAQNIKKVYIATGHIDLRRGMEGLEIVAKHPIEEMKTPPKSM